MISRALPEFQTHYLQLLLGGEPVRSLRPVSH